MALFLSQESWKDATLNPCFIPYPSLASVPHVLLAGDGRYLQISPLPSFLFPALPILPLPLHRILILDTVILHPSCLWCIVSLWPSGSRLGSLKQQTPQQPPTNPLTLWLQVSSRDQTRLHYLKSNIQLILLPGNPGPWDALHCHSHDAELNNSLNSWLNNGFPEVPSKTCPCGQIVILFVTFWVLYAQLTLCHFKSVCFLPVSQSQAGESM